MEESAAGILFYGYTIGDDDDNVWPWQLDEDSDAGEWETFAAAKLGLKEPDVPWEGNEEVHSAYWEKQRELVKTLECEVDYYCYMDDPVRYVALMTKNKCVDWEEAEEVTTEFLSVNVMDVRKLKRFCELMEIPWQEPKWYLAGALC
jgi:hypothetical protein